MRSDREKALAELAARQHQIVTRCQLRGELGLNPSSVDRLVRAGRLVVIRKGVYGIGGCPPDYRGALYAATVGFRVSVASHRAAAKLSRLPGGEALVEVTSPRWRRLRGTKLAGFELAIHESSHLAERDVVEIDGVLRTRVARTLVDLGTSVAMGHLESATLTLAIQDAVRRNLTDLGQLERTCARLAPDVRIGSKAFRVALNRFQPVLAGTESPPEVRVGQALLEAGHRIIPQYELVLGPGWTVRLDFYLPDFHRAVEVNPFSTHGGAQQHQYDIARALRIRRIHGIELINVGDEEIQRGCPELLAVLRTIERAA